MAQKCTKLTGSPQSVARHTISWARMVDSMMNEHPRNAGTQMSIETPHPITNMDEVYEGRTSSEIVATDIEGPLPEE